VRTPNCTTVVVSIDVLQNFSLSQRCEWRSKHSAILRHVEWYIVTDISEMPVQVCLTLKMKAPTLIETLVTVHQSTGRNKQEDLYIQRLYVTYL